MLCKKCLYSFGIKLLILMDVYSFWFGYIVLLVILWLVIFVNIRVGCKKLWVLNKVVWMSKVL